MEFRVPKVSISTFLALVALSTLTFRLGQVIFTQPTLILDSFAGKYEDPDYVLQIFDLKVRSVGSKVKVNFTQSGWVPEARPQKKIVVYFRVSDPQTKKELFLKRLHPLTISSTHRYFPVEETFADSRLSTDFLKKNKVVLDYFWVDQRGLEYTNPHKKQFRDWLYELEVARWLTFPAEL